MIQKPGQRRPLRPGHCGSQALELEVSVQGRGGSVEHRGGRFAVPGGVATAVICVSSQSWKRAIRTGVRTAAIDGAPSGFAPRDSRDSQVDRPVLRARRRPRPRSRRDGISVHRLDLKANEKTRNTSVAVFASVDLPHLVEDDVAAHADIVLDQKMGRGRPLTRSWRPLGRPSASRPPSISPCSVECSPRSPPPTSTVRSPSYTSSPSTHSRSRTSWGECVRKGSGRQCRFCENEVRQSVRGGRGPTLC